MTSDDFKKSTLNLKKAVPLMMKNHVAATPANYALWYTYVDNAIPQLNQEMDMVLENFGLCPPASAEQLYNSYVASKAETNVNELRTSMEVLVTEVASSMTDTLSDTSDFSKLIDKSFSDLARVEDEGLSIEEVMGVIRQLVTESREIRHSTQFLNSQLSTASEEISRLKSQLAEVQQDALFDSLSSLYNRKSFDRDLQALCAASQPMSLILLDIDHFKSFNDNYGHLFGDTVIRGLAKRLQTSCREGITAYRFGGEEFALIVPNKQLRIARQFAETVRRAIEKLSIKDRRSGKQVGNITASFGVAEFIEGDTPEALIEKADKLLYEAKQLGRNRVMPI
ncbi:diguanylate cyclase [Vibrio sp. SCSIO 43135]|uniref:diguanylate cyclase n=1 Tax=Vibrio paucivorans TaxID=2829489 RepID=A0A9X3CDK7_9VIBR|nr:MULTISPECIES: diguanylate cyclase [Vibrio]MCW8333661.1 diguanylate cyclase [Vibrio paucivorans]USD42903.1 diguanylate cyclase [Vibrio sp. SCSIO 43135]